MVTIGLFDGIHRGHQGLLRELRDWSSEMGAEPAVVTFEGHPQRVLRGRGPLQVLSLRQRLWLLAEQGVAATLVLPFTMELSHWTPEEFVERACRDALGARGILVGFDGAFGHGRKGTYEYLSARASELGVEVRRAAVEKVGDERVSSTLIRQGVLEGDLRRLERLLGRSFSVLGRVVRGDGRGRALGFPTANLDVEGAALPPTGVYFARVRARPDVRSIELDSAAQSFTVSLDERRGRGEAGGAAVVNLGKRPTFKDPAHPESEPTVEVHVLEFSGDLYGQWLELEFLHRHRPEQKFASAEELVLQIHSDIESFRRYREEALDGAV